MARFFPLALVLAGVLTLSGGVSVQAAQSQAQENVDPDQTPNNGDEVAVKIRSMVQDKVKAAQDVEKVRQAVQTAKASATFRERVKEAAGPVRELHVVVMTSPRVALARADLQKMVVEVDVQDHKRIKDNLSHIETDPIKAGSSAVTAADKQLIADNLLLENVAHEITHLSGVPEHNNLPPPGFGGPLVFGVYHYTNQILTELGIGYEALPDNCLPDQPPTIKKGVGGREGRIVDRIAANHENPPPTWNRAFPVRCPVPGVVTPEPTVPPTPEPTVPPTPSELPTEPPTPPPVTPVLGLLPLAGLGIALAALAARSPDR